MSAVERIVFLGSKRQGLSALQVLHEVGGERLVGAITIDDRADTRCALADFEAFARKTGIPLTVARNRREAEDAVRALKPDIGLVVGWYWLIGPDLLALPKRGFIGVHNSLLPRYRGTSPLIWALLNGDSEVGFSLFTLTDGMDDGPIWGTGKTRISATDYISDILARLEDELIVVLRSRLPDILSGRLVPTGQDESAATFCSQRTPRDGLIDWRRSAGEISSFVRAQSDPYPGAFTYLSGRKFLVWRAQAFEGTFFGIPGQTVRLTPDACWVASGQNTALIITAAEFDAERGSPLKFVKSLQTRFASVEPAE